MSKLRLLIWRLTVSEDKLLEKKQNWVLKQLRKLIRGATGGGYVPPTFWEKIRAALILVAIVTIASILYFALIAESIPR